MFSYCFFLNFLFIFLNSLNHYCSLIISVILTPKLSSITTTSPLATYLPFTSTSIASPAILLSSTIVPGANSRISFIDYFVLPSSTVTSRGTSIIKSIFSFCERALTSPANGWNAAGATLTSCCGTADCPCIGG